MKSVLIYSKNTMFREYLQSVLSGFEGVKTFGCMGDHENLQVLMNDDAPDFFLIDLYSRSVDDSVLSFLKENNVSGNSIVLITTVDNKHINYYNCFFNVQNFIFAEESSEEIINRLSLVLAGKLSAAEEMKNHILTTRECEILKLIASGSTSKEIAEELCISKNTVDTHRNKMLQKLNMANAASLVHYAYRSGLF